MIIHTALPSIVQCVYGAATDNKGIGEIARCFQSSHSIGSQLITWALMRFMRPASGSEW